MTNLTLTPTAITRKDSGWWTVIADGKEWGIPPEDRDTKVSNEAIAKEIEASIGKPIDLDAWEKPDGSTRMIFGKAKDKKGGGGATAYRNTADGQRLEQANMNRRTALMTAKEVGERWDVTGTAVLDLANLFWDWLQAPFQTSGSLSKGKAAEGPSTTSAGGPPQEPPLSPPADTEGETDSSGGRASASGAAPSDDDYAGELRTKLRALGTEAGYEDDEKLCGLLGVQSIDGMSVIQSEKYIGHLERFIAKRKVPA